MAVKRKPSAKGVKRRSSRPSFISPRAQPVYGSHFPSLNNLPIQAKLTIGQPGDKYEQEADRVADQVMRMSDADVAQQVETGTIQPMQIQRMCPECEEEHALQRQPEEEEELIPKEIASQTPQVSSGLESRINSLKTGGQPLDPATRAFFEPRFGHDFSQVRVHADAKAAEAAGAVNALGYTVGRDVVFGAGQYTPQTGKGKRLMAHELTHVVQQRISGGAPFIQRDPITGTQSTTSIYELSQFGRSFRQEQMGRTMAGVDLNLAYDPATSRFTVTFPLVWIFAHSWSNSQRNTYVNNFRTSVRRVWNNRFTLIKTRAPRRSAHVKIKFDNLIIPQMRSAQYEQAQLSRQNARRWTMDVRDLRVRASVGRAVRTVRLGASSTRRQRRSAAALRRHSSFSISGTGGRRTFTQAAAPHEFGHMIGLGDEYLVDVSGGRVPPAARGHINARIMNVGENVTADAYVPFAKWLSRLTSSTWRIGRRVR